MEQFFDKLYDVICINTIKDGTKINFKFAYIIDSKKQEVKKEYEKNQLTFILK